MVFAYGTSCDSKGMVSSLVKSFNGLFSPRRDFSQRDIMKYMYSSLNWNHTFIGGSYALREFTGDTWVPNDVDVFMTLPDEEFEGKFMNEVKGIIHENCGTITNVNDHRSPQFKRSTEDEKFDEAIRGTIKCDIPSVGKPIQFVHLSTPIGSSGRDIYTRITDLPSCVSYTIDSEGHKLFNVPEKAREALFERKVSYYRVCDKRRQKYIDRCYQFFTDC